MKLSRAQQRLTVSEGLAVGMLFHGRDILRFERRRLEDAFRAAYIGWHSRDAFPLVLADCAAGRPVFGTMTYAEESRISWLFYWAVVGEELVPVPRSEIHLDEVGLDEFAGMLGGTSDGRMAGLYGPWVAWDWGDLVYALYAELGIPLHDD